MSCETLESGLALLLVTDLEERVELVNKISTKKNQVFWVRTIDQALSFIELKSVDLILTEAHLPDGSGFDLLRHMRENYPLVRCIVMTNNGSIQDAVTSIKLGALDYLSQPDSFFLAHSVRKAVQTLENDHAPALNVTEANNGVQLIGNSEAISTVAVKIRKAAMTTATVVITGESGTGKELAAKSIHQLSEQRDKAFVPVNCSAIPENLLESELFGRVKGSFTNATETKNGFFQSANGGTIFLDEISTMSLGMQAKLLRVLQDKIVYKVGSSEPEQIELRIILATNQNLKALVAEGKFRQDLYYRINVIPIYIPPLRERTTDIILLAQRFLKQSCIEYQKPGIQFSNIVLEKFKNYSWPGNVRELENLIAQLVVMVDSKIIEVTDLPRHLRFSLSRPLALHSLEEHETAYIQQVLQFTRGNKTRAAEILGIDRKTLRLKMKDQTIINK